MINTKLQSIIDTKAAIGNAITNKGGTITTNTPFFNYAAQIDGISTGTPQTIFQASDGSKWALTNAVNLTNVSNNVTSDFNYWQPANNSTSDPILNVGTVGANISGNIQLVPVNQVNIAQYENIVINDTTGAKYVGYNGYDAVTNPTPTGNATFNRWLLNNSASGTILFANTTVTNGGTFNGPNVSVNEANMPFVNNTASLGGDIYTLATNNGFIYAGGQTNFTVRKFREDNLAFVANSASYGQRINAVTINNGFVFVGGAGANRTIKKYHESNLVLSATSGDYFATIQTLVTNNGFIYAGGYETIAKYHESNLVKVSNSAAIGEEIYSLKINNGFIYSGGYFNGNFVRKWHESNFAFVSNTSTYGHYIHSMGISNGFIYVGGFPLTGTNRGISKYYESNLALVGNTVNYGGFILSLTINNGFIYVGGETSNLDFTNGSVKKYFESNLAFLNNTANYGGVIYGVVTNNNFIYAGGDTNRTVQKFAESSLTPETLTFYTATKIKE
jgi:hypothetical protein